MIEFTRIKNDANGNPRYVCHFLNLLSDSDFPAEVVNKDGSRMSSDEVILYIYKESRVGYGYRKALQRAHKLGGRKYHTKAYGGGIVFQSYNIRELERDIEELVKKESEE